MTTDVAIVIVNYKTPDLVVDCLRSLAPEVAELPVVRVIVTDNASGDGSVEKLSAAIDANGWRDWAKVAPLPVNGGFSYGNNRGIELTGDARYVLLLNSDTIVHPGVLRHCVGVMDAEPKIGVMSVLLKNPDGSMQNAARRFPTPARLALNQLGLPQKLPGVFGWADTEDPGWDRLTVKRDVDWLGGAFLFIRGDVLRKIGGLDEDFFFYGEDIEFCHRVRRNGYRVHYDPATSIMHIGGASGSPDGEAKRVAARARNVNMWKARYLNQRKCYGVLAPLFVRGVDVAVFGLRSIKLWITGRKNSPEYALQRDVFFILLKLPSAPRGGKA
jgi:GT2 family glycosyltransferase